MKEISIDQLINIAKDAHRNNKKWHFHILTKDCFLNTNKSKNALILECENEVFVVYSEHMYLEVDKELVKMLHGSDIVNENKISDKVDDKIKEITKRAKNLNKKGIHWHHHMLFPDCVFNKHKGKWKIIFEDPLENKIYELLSDTEPKENLRAIEVLFYSQKS